MSRPGRNEKKDEKSRQGVISLGGLFFALTQKNFGRRCDLLSHLILFFLARARIGDVASFRAIQVAQGMLTPMTAPVQTRTMALPVAAQRIGGNTSRGEAA